MKIDSINIGYSRSPVFYKTRLSNIVVFLIKSTLNKYMYQKCTIQYKSIYLISFKTNVYE